MKTVRKGGVLAILLLLLSLMLTAYCAVLYQLPYAQYSKVLSVVKNAGIQDADVIERIRWGIIGVQGTWGPLWCLLLAQNGLAIYMVYHVVKSARDSSNV